MLLVWLLFYDAGLGAPSLLLVWDLGAPPLLLDLGDWVLLL